MTGPGAEGTFALTDQDDGFVPISLVVGICNVM
jgi:hypothetical protein